jgi:hypothetical protein
MQLDISRCQFFEPLPLLACLLSPLDARCRNVAYVALQEAHLAFEHALTIAADTDLSNGRFALESNDATTPPGGHAIFPCR